MIKTFKYRVIASLSAIFLVVALSVIAIFIEVQEIRETNTRLETLRWPTTEASREMETGIQESLAGLRGWLLLRTEDQRQSRLEGWARIDSTLSSMQVLSANWTNPENNLRLSKITPMLQTFRNHQMRIDDLSLTDPIQANAILAEEAAPLAAEILLILEAMVEDQRILIGDDILQLNDEVRALETTSTAFLLVTFIVAAIAGYALIRSVVSPLRSAVQAANKVSELDLDSEIALGGTTEIRSLGTALEEMRSHLSKNHIKMVSLNEELTQFSYRTSHDLKAPLLTVRSLALAMNEDIEEGNYAEVSRYASNIVDRVDRLEALITDILNLAKADLEETSVEEFDLRVALEDIREKLSVMYVDNNVDFAIDIDPSTTIKAEKVRIAQVLENLISNAIKYRDPQKSDPFVRVSAQQSKQGIELRVEDNGLGIPAELTDRVFKMFQRFHPNVSFGSGLGMYIVKKHLDNMNAAISFTSSDQGTTFNILVPDNG